MLAVFYKLSDPKKRADETTEAFYQVKKRAIKRRTYKAFRSEMAYFQEEREPAGQKVAQHISKILLDHPLAEPIQRQHLEALFDDKLKNNIVNAFISSCFKFSDSAKAAATGGLYDLSHNQTHNWGVNSVWTAALVAENTPIRLFSPLLPSSGGRPQDSLFTAGSSAFALEIAIKEGYRLNFDSKGEISLIPPDEPNLHARLPTREEQMHIYTWSCTKQTEAKEHFAALLTASSLPASSLSFSYSPSLTALPSSLAPSSMASSDLVRRLQTLEVETQQASPSYQAITHAYSHSAIKTSSKPSIEAAEAKPKGPKP